MLGRSNLPRMRYLGVDEAIPLPGLRLVLTRGVPGPWGELAKAIFHVKRLPVAAVAQEAGSDDAALVRWTGAANAPTAVWNDEPARSDRNGILFLAERLAPEPALLPRAARERALCLGLADAIAGESGFGWCRRLMMVELMMRAPTLPAPLLELRNRLAWRYGWSDAAAAAAPGRCAEVLALLAHRLHAQREAGSPYLVGDALSVADLTWATFAALVRPLPEALCPMPAQTRAMYESKHPAVEAALDPALLAHRDFVYEKHLPLPLDF
jgi:glutathione S-transferase